MSPGVLSVGWGYNRARVCPLKTKCSMPSAPNTFSNAISTRLALWFNCSIILALEKTKRASSRSSCTFPRIKTPATSPSTVCRRACNSNCCRAVCESVARDKGSPHSSLRSTEKRKASVRASRFRVSAARRLCCMATFFMHPALRRSSFCS